MKTLTALTVPILSLSPAHAAKLRSLRDVPQIHAWQDAYGVCVYSTDEPKVAKACPAFDRLKKKMEAKGYCMVGHAEVGRASKDKKHCYTITNLPDPEQWNLTLERLASRPSEIVDNNPTEEAIGMPLSKVVPHCIKLHERNP